MGCGSWTRDSYVSYSTTKGMSVSTDGMISGSYSNQDMFKARNIDSALDPKNVIRECCDTEEHPSTIPVILALDVTGSMNDVSVEIAKKLNVIMTKLYEDIADVEFMIMGIGDLAYDNSPIQISQFESDIRIAEQLDKLWFENGGGGNDYESYTAAWYMGSRHTKIDCNKRGKKGIIITIGDERLNPSEYSTEQFGKVIAAFNKLRNGIKIETFAGKVTKAIETEDFKSALMLLRKRPGELARKLDHLLRNTTDKNAVVNTFKDVASEVSTPVLLQVKEHFAHRTDKLESRVFFPKGNLARCYCIENTLSDIDEKYCNAIVKICENALVENYKSKDFLGNVYLSEEFKNYIVPFSQRSASKALKTIVRGSRLKIEDNTKALRAFCWWTNMDDSDDNWSNGRVDLDLSAAIFDENWNYMEHVSYTNLRSDKYKACHSGDITNGGSVDGDGVTEFLDVDIDSVVKYGARYIIYQVYNFTGQKLSDMPHAMFGWMSREDVKSGEIYEPKTVEQKMDLASQSTVCIPVIFDCVNREVIWCDMNLSLNGCHSNYGGNNVESNLSGVAATCYSMVNMSKPNLYDLIELHIRARGLRIDNKEDADIIFDVNDGITPFDTEVFSGEYI